MKRLNPPKPLHSADLRQLALAYVGRYATSEAKLAAYLARKVRDRGWAEAGSAGDAISALVNSLAQHRYVDDQAYADMKANSLARRGYGPRRIRLALGAAGIAPETAAQALEDTGSDADALALAYARRRRLGPFSTQPEDPRQKARATAALLRAGHDYETVRRVLDLEQDFVHNSLGRLDI
jgi:regulatory protein